MLPQERNISTEKIKKKKKGKEKEKTNQRHSPGTDGSCARNAKEAPGARRRLHASRRKTQKNNNKKEKEKRKEEKKKTAACKEVMEVRGSAWKSAARMSCSCTKKAVSSRHGYPC